MRRACLWMVAAFATIHSHGQQPLAVDTTFRTTLQDLYVADLLFLDDGNLLITGSLRFVSDLEPKFLAVLDQQGNEIFSLNSNYGGVIQPWNDQYYIQGGQFHHRLNGDFTADYSWQQNANVFTSAVHGGAMHVNPDGSTIVTGSIDLKSFADTVTTTMYQCCFLKFDPDGHRDTTFTPRQCVSGFVNAIWEQPDGKFLLAGMQDFFDGQDVGSVLKVWPDGTIDTTFATNFRGHVGDYYTYPDGRMLLTGRIIYSPDYPGDTLHVVRILPDGTMDMSYPNDTEYNKPGIFYPSSIGASSIFELEENVLVILGAFTHVEGEEVGGIIAIDTAGNILQDYFTGLGCDSALFLNSQINRRSLTRMEQAPDGNYYIYGSYGGFDDGYGNGFYQDQMLITRLHALNVGVTELQKPEPLRLWPNPGTEVVNIDTGCGQCTYTLAMRDALGRVVIDPQRTVGPSTLDLHRVAPGAYGIELVLNDGSRRTANWIKQ